MPIDPYAPCPGGTGKKIKFCCPDLQGELSTIEDMLAGDQRLACLEHINKLEAKHPDRACLLSVKSLLELELADEGKAEATVARFKEKYPGNPIALAQEAMLKAYKQGGKAAVESLQLALSAAGNAIPPQVYNAIFTVAQQLIVEGEYPAAIGHLSMLLMLGNSEDQGNETVLSGILGSPNLPLLMKESQPLAPAPEGALWAASFTKILDSVNNLHWAEAVQEYVALANSAGDWPPIWRNIATLRLWLADTPGAIVALRKFARQPLGSSAAPPLDEMVEAEALAQLLDTQNADYTDAINITYPVNDAEAVIARLSADPRCQKMSLDLAQLAKDDEPPPKLAVWILDRPIAATGKGITREQVSTLVGQAFLYGRQTDRDARLELATFRDETLAKSQEVLSAVLGDAIGAAAGEEVVSRVLTVKHALEWSWRLPNDTPPDEREAMLAAEVQRVFIEKWPAMKLKVLDGRTPLEASRDPAMRVPLLAAVLQLELAAQGGLESLDFNDLRSKLNLPLAGPVEPESGNILRVPLARLHRVDVGKLDDEQLFLGYLRAARNSHSRAIQRFSKELLNRPALRSKVPKQEIYGLLGQIERNPQKAIEYIQLARTAAEEEGKSSAPWDITEMAMRLAIGDWKEAEQLMTHIQSEHIREPGVAQMLMQVMVESGIINPDGTPTRPPQAAAGQPGLAAGGTMPASEAGKLWTPDGGAAPAGEKKSVIWTPE